MGKYLTKIIMGCFLPLVLITAFSVGTMAFSKYYHQERVEAKDLSVLLSEIMRITVWLGGNILYKMLGSESIPDIYHRKCPSKTLTVLIHGYGDSPYTWWWMKKQLLARGLGPIYAIALQSSLDSIAILAKQLQSILRFFCYPKVNLVGHSMGGLVAAYYTEYYAKRHSVKKVITIGSPLKGTSLACFIPGQSATEMCYNSPFVQALRNRIQRNDSTRYVHIASKADTVIVPWNSGVLNKNSGQVNILEEEGHTGLLFSPKVAKIVGDFLAEDNESPVALWRTRL